MKLTIGKWPGWPLTGIQNCNCQVVIKFNAFKPYSIYSSNAYQYAFNCFYIYNDTFVLDFSTTVVLFLFFLAFFHFFVQDKMRFSIRFTHYLSSIFSYCFGFALFRSNRLIKNMYFCFLRYDDFFFS